MRYLTTALLTVPLVYIGIFAVLTFNQRGMLYQPSAAFVTPAQAGLADFEMLRLKTDDGETLEAWFRAPKDGEAPLIVYFHGNAGALVDRKNRFGKLARRGYGVLAISWRGYAGSTGAPTETGLMHDAEAAYAEARRRVSSQRIVLMGESLGTGVATMLAARRQAAALALDSPYDSVVAVAGGHFPMFPVSLVLQDTFHADRAIEKVHIPVLMVVGEDDLVTPAAAARRLFSRANEPKQMMALAGVGHIAMSSPGALERTMEWIDMALKSSRERDPAQ